MHGGSEGTHRCDVDEGDADVVLGEVAEAARVGLVELAVAVGDPGPLVQEAVRPARRRLAERPVLAVAALGRVAPELADLLLRGAKDDPLLLPAEQLLKLVARGLRTYLQHVSLGGNCVFAREK
jgi:hypothetical protein